jgi:heptosyltransferase II
MKLLKNIYMAKYKIKNRQTALVASAINATGFLIWGWQRLFSPSLKNLKPNRILVVQLDELGDVLLSTPALRYLRRVFPQAHITILVRDIGGQVLENNPDIDEIVTVSVPRLEATPKKYKQDMAAIKRAVRKIQTEKLGKFDLGIDLRADIRTIYILKLLKIPVRVSQAIRSGGFWLTHTAPYLGLRHEAERKLGIVKYIKPGDFGSEKLRFDITDAAKNEAQSILKKNGLAENQPVAVFHIFAGWPPKEWPPSRFAEIAVYLKKRYNLAVVIIGTKSEMERVNRTSLQNSGVYNLAGQTDLQQTAAIIARARLFIGNDSGPMHLACALQTPTLALFGQNTPRRYGPWKNKSITLYHPVSCSPCAQTECRRQPRCLELITVSEVKAAVAKLLA